MSLKMLSHTQLLSNDSVKARLHRRFLSLQLNAIFVAPKLQLQNRTCKPLCDIAAIFDKVESQGPLGRFFHAGFQFVFVWLWLIQTIKTCVRLYLRLHRALGTVLAIHKQAAATAKSSSIFMLVYRYIFRVVSKSKPKKSKLTKKKIE